MFCGRCSIKTLLAACCALFILGLSAALASLPPESGDIHISVGNNENACDAGYKTAQINDESRCASKGDDLDDEALRELELLRNGLRAWFEEAFTLEGFSRLSSNQSPSESKKNKKAEKNISLKDLKGGRFDGRYDAKSRPHSEVANLFWVEPLKRIRFQLFV